MTYDEKKKKILGETRDLLSQYNDIFYKTIELISKTNHILDDDADIQQKLDWAYFISHTAEMQKLIRLSAALQYVEEPQDKQTISNLKENIKVNKKNKKCISEK